MVRGRELATLKTHSVCHSSQGRAKVIFVYYQRLFVFKSVSSSSERDLSSTRVSPRGSLVVLDLPPTLLSGNLHLGHVLPLLPDEISSCSPYLHNGTGGNKTHTSHSARCHLGFCVGRRLTLFFYLAFSHKDDRRITSPPFLLFPSTSEPRLTASSALILPSSPLPLLSPSAPILQMFEYTQDYRGEKKTWEERGARRLPRWHGD